ncbi:MAG: inositol 2-dehydrogenase, partial [Spirochaetaceae bacterium]|nr:inositol 2-dehydrogenase [Spirochaetaceae bacterium]
MSQDVNIGILGAGRIGSFHAELLTKRVEGVQVAAIADVHLPAAEECAKKFDIPLASSQVEDIFDNPDIDAVVICSSTDTHADFIQAAAKAGKHIFCEKPIDLDLAKIDETLAVVEECGVKLQIGFNRRFDPNFSRVRQGIEAGEIGDLHFLRVASRDPSPPPVEYVKRSGGLFRDMTIHDFDMVRFISGSEVEEVYASGAVLVDPEIGKTGDIDTAVINLKFKNGALGIIDNSRKAVYGYDQRIEAFGSEGML